MKVILALELLLLAAGVAWLAAIPDGPTAAAPTAPFGVDRPGLDDYAWGLSVFVLKLSPALLILYRMYLGLRHVRHKHEVELVWAHRPIPESVTHLTQPRITHNPHYPAQPLPPAVPLLEDHTLPIEVPSFAQLLDRGLVGPGQPLILGYTDHGPLTGSWKDLYSSAVAGIPGSGKTTTVRFLAAQAALHGARFAILDPHADTGEESLAATLSALQPVMLCEPAMHERDMLAVAKLLQAQLDARLQGSTDRTPILLAIDKYTRLMRLSIAGPISGLVEAVAQEGRKVGIFCTLSGQSWTAPRAGGTPLRDSLASCYVHRLRRNQARLLLSTEEARLAETLEPGRASLLRTNGECGPVGIPLCTASDVERVGYQLATTRLPTSIPMGADGDIREATPVANITQATSASGSHTVVPAEARQAADLFLAGNDPAAIVLQLRSIRSDQGRRYQTALGEVLELVRLGVKAAQERV